MNKENIAKYLDREACRNTELNKSTDLSPKAEKIAIYLSKEQGKPINQMTENELKAAIADLERKIAQEKKESKKKFKGGVDKVKLAAYLDKANKESKQ